MLFHQKRIDANLPVLLQLIRINRKLSGNGFGVGLIADVKVHADVAHPMWFGDRLCLVDKRLARFKLTDL